MFAVQRKLNSYEELRKNKALIQLYMSTFY